MGLDGPALKRFPPSAYVCDPGKSRPSAGPFLFFLLRRRKKLFQRGGFLLACTIDRSMSPLGGIFGFRQSCLHALAQEPRRTERTKNPKKDLPAHPDSSSPPPARLSDLNSGAWLTLPTAHRRAAGKGCRSPITAWSGAASETAAVGFESSATAWPCRRLVQLSHPSTSQTAWAPSRFPTPSLSDGGSPPAF